MKEPTLEVFACAKPLLEAAVSGRLRSEEILRSIIAVPMMLTTQDHQSAVVSQNALTRAFYNNSNEETENELVC